MAWGRWISLLTVFVVLGCDEDGNNGPSAPCVESTQIQGDLRPLWTASIEGLAGKPQVAVDWHGNAFVAGRSNTTYDIWTPGATDPTGGTAETFVAALDPDGGLLWKRSLPWSLVPISVGVDGDGVVYCLTFDMAAPSGDASVTRLDPSGNLLGTFALQNANSFQTNFFAVSPSGEIVAGNAGVVRGFDAAGLERWSRSGQRTFITQVAFDRSGALMVSGMAADAFDWVSPPLLLGTRNGAFVTKLSTTDGAVLSASLIPHEVPTALSGDGPRTLLMTAVAEQIDATGTGMIRLKANAFENEATALGNSWSTSVDVAAGDYFTQLAPALDGGLFAAGGIETGALDFGLGPLLPGGVFVVRLDGSGHPVASARFPNASADTYSLATDGQGNAFVSVLGWPPFDFGTGIFEASPSHSGEVFAVTKLSPAPPSSPGRRCAPAAAGAILEVHSIRAPVQLALSETHLAVATSNDVFLVPSAGGEPRVFAIAQDGIVGVALHAGRVYWANGGGSVGATEGGRDGRILSQSIEPDSTPEVLVEHQDGLEGIAVDDQRLVFSVGLVSTGTSVSLGKLVSVPLEGGPPTVLAADLVASARFALVGGETVVAASTDTPGTARILRIARDGTPTLLAMIDGNVTGVAVDGATVYVLDGAEGEGWRVQSVPLAGGPPTVLGTGPAPPRSQLVVAGKQLVFTSTDAARGIGGLMSLPITGQAPAKTLLGGINLGAPAARGSRLAYFTKNVSYWTVIATTP